MKLGVHVGKGGKASVQEGGFEKDPLQAEASKGLADPLSDSLGGAVQFDGGGPPSGGPPGGGDPLSTATAGVASATGGLPFGDTIQSSFGRHDVSGVKAGVGGSAGRAASAMGARGFATGEKVGFSGSPSLHTAAHEAAHVVQQRGGVRLDRGVGKAGDAYEQHADAVADAVVSGRSAEGLLDRYAGGAGPAPAGDAVQHELTRSHVEKAQLSLSGPAFGVPGLKWNVQAEGEREVESSLKGGLNPQTTVKASLTGGLRYDLWFLEVGLDLVGDVEIKVDGNVSTGDALRQGITEVARWYGASRLGDVATKRGELETSFTTHRSEILGAYRELRDLLDQGKFNDFKTGAQSWWYFSKSPRVKASEAIDGVHRDIGSLFAVAKATGSEILAAKHFVDKDALLTDFTEAGDTQPSQAKKNVDRSQGKFLTKYDPAKAKLLQAFDSLDTVKVLTRTPGVQFTGAVGANVSGKLGFGGPSEEPVIESTALVPYDPENIEIPKEEGGNEVAAQVGVAKRITSGEDVLFDLNGKNVVRGKLGAKVGPFGAEFKADREAEGDEQVKWKLELEGKAEGSLSETLAGESAEQISTALVPLTNPSQLATVDDVGTGLARFSSWVKSAVGGTKLGKWLGKHGSGDGGGEVALGGEIELQFERASRTAPWQLKETKGKVSLGLFAGAKAGLNFGPLAKKLGKVEGQIQEGFKVSASFP